MVDAGGNELLTLATFEDVVEVFRGAKGHGKEMLRETEDVVEVFRVARGHGSQMLRELEDDVMEVWDVVARVAVGSWVVDLRVVDVGRVVGSAEVVIGTKLGSSTVNGLCVGGASRTSIDVIPPRR